MGPGQKPDRPDQFPAAVKIENNEILVLLTKYSQKSREHKASQALADVLAIEVQALHARLFYETRKVYPHITEVTGCDGFRKLKDPEGLEYNYYVAVPPAPHPYAIGLDLPPTFPPGG